MAATFTRCSNDNIFWFVKEIIQQEIFLETRRWSELEYRYLLRGTGIANTRTLATKSAPTKSQVKTFEWGTNNNPENLNQGFTHCFFVGFTSEADRAIYLPHPAHLAFVEILKPILDKVLVIDYWASE